MMMELYEIIMITREKCTYKGRIWMNRKRKMVVTWLVLAALVLSTFGSFADSKKEGDDQEVLATGLIEATPAEMKAFNAKVVKTDKVKLNKIGLERVNKEKKIKNKTLLDPSLAVAVGEEPISASGVEVPAADLPGAVDNSQLAYFPPIRSQGSLGSCASFANTYYLTTYMTALVRGWDAKNGGDQYRFSPKWSYNMVNGGSNSGSSMEGNLSLVIRNGAATWADFPYDSNYREWPLDGAVWENAINFRMEHYGNVYNLDTTDGLSELKQYLNNGYVLTFATYIRSWGFETLKDDPATSLDDAFVGQDVGYWVNGTDGGHAMTIVGYNDNLWVDINHNGVVDSGEKGALKIANSWGTGYYNDGYLWFAYDGLKTVSDVAGAPTSGRRQGFWGDKAYWITAKESYSPKLLAEFTLNTNKRNQVYQTLSYSDVQSNSPSSTYYPYTLTYDGGAYAFDGTTTTCDGTFVLDYTDLIDNNQLDLSSDWKWYLNTRDTNADGNALLLKSFKLIDRQQDVERASTAAFPVSADGQTLVNSIVYNFNEQPSAPAIASHTPVADDLYVNIQAPIEIVYNQIVEFVNEVGVHLTDDTAGTEVVINPSLSGTNLNLNVTSDDLVFEHQYTVTIDSGTVENAYGMACDAYSFAFTVEPYRDLTPPVLLSHTPDDQAVEVALETTVELVFDEEVLVTYDSGVHLEEASSGTLVSATTSENGNVITLTPSDALAYGTEYLVVIDQEGVINMAELPCDFTEFSFTTEVYQDETAPVVLSTTPEDQASGVAINANIGMVFDETITIDQSSSIHLTDVTTGQNVAISPTASDVTLNLNPDADLDYEHQYAVSLDAGAVVNDASLPNVAYSFGFTTEIYMDQEAPYVLETAPVDGSDSAAVETTITVVFSEAVADTFDSVTVTTSKRVKKDIIVTDVAVSTSYNDGTLVITPDSSLDGGTTYTVTVPAAAVVDAVGNVMASDYEMTFKTAKSTDDGKTNNGKKPKK